MVQNKIKIAAGHYHLFHRLAPTVALAKGYLTRFFKNSFLVERRP